MLGQQPGAVRREPAEVEEFQWPSVDLVRLAVPRDLPTVEVPVGNVGSWILQHGMREIGGNEVHPALVDEQHSTGIDDAVSSKPFPPPVEELSGEVGDREKAEVVHPRG